MPLPENSATLWRASGAQVVNANPGLGEYEATVKFSRNLGDDCHILIGDGQACSAEALARLLAEELAAGGLSGRFQVVEVRIRER